MTVDPSTLTLAEKAGQSLELTAVQPALDLSQTSVAAVLIAAGYAVYCQAGPRSIILFSLLGALGHLVGVMAAVDEEPPGLDRGQLAADMGDPVHLGQPGNGEGLRAMGGRQQGQRQGGEHRAAAGQLDQPLGRRHRPGVDRPAGQEAVQVVGQGVGLMNETMGAGQVVQAFKEDWIAACERLNGFMGD